MTNAGEDKTILRVKGESSFGDNEHDREVSRKEYVKKLASAILTVYHKHGQAKLKVVGAPSLSNATKAAIVARGEAQKKGLDLVIEPNFDNADFDGSMKTAILLKITERQGA